MIIRDVEYDKIFMGSINYGTDLLEELENICVEKGIQLGHIEALGAVQKACIGYYDQKSREYGYNTLENPHEILTLSGNVSIKDEKPMVHAHIVLADGKGRACGGHLAAGTVVFACEFLIYSFKGKVLKRGFDEKTDLSLWK